MNSTTATENRTATTTTHARLAFLDWIRGIAALAVVIQHAAERVFPSFEKFSHDSFNIGKFGVAIFFLTSGFVIPLTLEKGKSLRHFWINRFFRLYPLYWVSLLLVVVLYFIGLPNALPPGFTSNLPRNLLANVTMFQEFLRIPHAIGLYYTLTLELAFYILFTVLFHWNLHKATVLHAAAAMVLQTTVTIVLPLALHRRMPMAEIFYFTCFFIGTAIYRHAYGGLSVKSLATLVGILGVLTAIGAHLNYDLYKKANLDEQFTFAGAYLPWLLAYTVFIGSFAYRSKAYPRLFTWLGEISYSMYLLHPVMIILAALIAGPSLSVAFVVAATLLFSHISFNYLERPMIGVGKKLSRPRSAAAPAALAAHAASQ